MSSTETAFGAAVWSLPPLILHPFNENVAAHTLLENSRAALMLSGLVSQDGTELDVLKRRLLSGRYAEIRMLFFLGKDISRWIGQCLESAARIPELASSSIAGQSFARLLIAGPPQKVKEKLQQWGVADYSAIFSRALGLHALFVAPPIFDLLADEFLHHYHRYADHLYSAYLETVPHCTLNAVNFQFDLYASGEYTRLLETEWEKPER